MLRTAALTLALLLSGVASPSVVSATPGMVSASGCHGHPRHCHSRGDLRRNTRGRLYVPGAFSHGHRSRHRRRHR